jgi:hypothetical protein
VPFHPLEPTATLDEPVPPKLAVAIAQNDDAFFHVAAGGTWLLRDEATALAAPVVGCDGALNQMIMQHCWIPSQRLGELLETSKRMSLAM